MRKGYLVVSNGVGGDEGLTGFRQRRDSFAAMRDDGESTGNRRVRTTADPFGDDNQKNKNDSSEDNVNSRGNNDTGWLSSGGFRCLVVAVFVWGGKNPGIKYGQVWWNDGEEEQEDADHLWDVKHVSALKEERQADQRNNRHADDRACKGLCPGFVVIRKHCGTAFRHA